MIEIKEYLDSKNKSPFAKWFDGLDAQAALKVNTYITRLSNRNFSQLKSVGNGVHECRINWGAGYRVYLGKEGDKIIILLGGGTKRQQNKDIKKAKACWLDYKERKKGK